MSQVDRVHFFPVIWWVVVLFVIWYGMIVVNILPKYYKVMRSRVLFEVYLFKTIKEDEYVMHLIKKFFHGWFNEVIKLFSVGMIMKYSKNSIEGRIEKKNFSDNINKQHDKNIKSKKLLERTSINKLLKNEILILFYTLFIISLIFVLLYKQYINEDTIKRFCIIMMVFCLYKLIFVELKRKLLSTMPTDEVGRTKIFKDVYDEYEKYGRELVFKVINSWRETKPEELDKRLSEFYKWRELWVKIYKIIRPVLILIYKYSNVILLMAQIIELVNGYVYINFKEKFNNSILLKNSFFFFYKTIFFIVRLNFKLVKFLLLLIYRILYLYYNMIYKWQNLSLTEFFFKRLEGILIIMLLLTFNITFIWRIIILLLILVIMVPIIDKYIYTLPRELLDCDFDAVSFKRMKISFVYSLMWGFYETCYSGRNPDLRDKNYIGEVEFWHLNLNRVEMWGKLYIYEKFDILCWLVFKEEKKEPFLVTFEEEIQPVQFPTYRSYEWLIRSFSNSTGSLITPDSMDFFMLKEIIYLSYLYLNETSVLKIEVLDNKYLKEMHENAMKIWREKLFILWDIEYFYIGESKITNWLEVEEEPLAEIEPIVTSKWINYKENEDLKRFIWELSKKDINERKQFFLNKLTFIKNGKKKRWYYKNIVEIIWKENEFYFDNMNYYYYNKMEDDIKTRLDFNREEYEQLKAINDKKDFENYLIMMVEKWRKEWKDDNNLLKPLEGISEKKNYVYYENYLIGNVFLITEFVKKLFFRGKGTKLTKMKQNYLKRKNYRTVMSRTKPENNLIMKFEKFLVQYKKIHGSNHLLLITESFMTNVTSKKLSHYVAENIKYPINRVKIKNRSIESYILLPHVTLPLAIENYKSFDFSLGLKGTVEEKIEIVKVYNTMIRLEKTKLQVVDFGGNLKYKEIGVKDKSWENLKEYEDYKIEISEVIGKKKIINKQYVDNVKSNLKKELNHLEKNFNKDDRSGMNDYLDKSIVENDLKDIVFEEVDEEIYLAWKDYWDLIREIINNYNKMNGNISELSKYYLEYIKNIKNKIENAGDNIKKFSENNSIEYKNELFGKDKVVNVQYDKKIVDVQQLKQSMKLAKTVEEYKKLMQVREKIYFDEGLKKFELGEYKMDLANKLEHNALKELDNKIEDI
jgi:phage host-nuclease inhibitor protein Gam